MLTIVFGFVRLPYKNYEFKKKIKINDDQFERNMMQCIAKPKNSLTQLNQLCTPA